MLFFSKSPIFSPKFEYRNKNNPFLSKNLSANSNALRLSYIISSYLIKDCPTN